MCLLGAPVLGLAAGHAVPNPPGDGPGTLQLLLGAGVPAAVSFFTARYAAKASRLRAIVWALASVAATGTLLLLLYLLVVLVIRPS